MSKQKTDIQTFKKAEIVAIIDGSRMTVAERVACINKVEAHPKSFFTRKDLENMGINLVYTGKLTAEDKSFLARETGSNVWMCVAGAVIISVGFFTKEPGLEFLSALFGTAGIMRGAFKIKELWEYVKDIKMGMIR